MEDDYEPKVITLDEDHALVNMVSFSPDSPYLALASGYRPAPITVWSMETKVSMFTLRGHDRGLYSISFSPDGKLLASGSLDRSIKI